MDELVSVRVMAGCMIRLNTVGGSGVVMSPEEAREVIAMLDKAIEEVTE